MTMSTNSKTVIPSPFKGISNNHSELHSQLAQTGTVLPYHPFGYNQKRSEGNGCITLLFLMECFLLGRSRSGVGAEVGVDVFRPESGLESESLKIRRLRSPAQDTEECISGRGYADR